MAYRGTFSVIVSAVTVGTPVRIAPRSVGAGSRLIQNLDGANPIFIGPDNGVTAANGFRLSSGQSMELDENKGDIWAVATGGTCDTRVLVS